MTKLEDRTKAYIFSQLKQYLPDDLTNGTLICIKNINKPDMIKLLEQYQSYYKVEQRQRKIVVDNDKRPRLRVLE